MGEDRFCRDDVLPMGYAGTFDSHCSTLLIAVYRKVREVDNDKV